MPEFLPTRFVKHDDREQPTAADFAGVAIHYAYKSIAGYLRTACHIEERRNRPDRLYWSEEERLVTCKLCHKKQFGAGRPVSTAPIRGPIAMARALRGLTGSGCECLALGREGCPVHSREAR